MQLLAGRVAELVTIENGRCATVCEVPFLL